jgi:hypothetical protein
LKEKRRRVLRFLKGLREQRESEAVRLAVEFENNQGKVQLQ